MIVTLSLDVQVDVMVETEVHTASVDISAPPRSSHMVERAKELERLMQRFEEVAQLLVDYDVA